MALIEDEEDCSASAAAAVAAARAVCDKSWPLIVVLGARAGKTMYQQPVAYVNASPISCHREVSSVFLERKKTEDKQLGFPVVVANLIAPNFHLLLILFGARTSFSSKLLSSSSSFLGVACVKLFVGR